MLLTQPTTGSSFSVFEPLALHLSVLQFVVVLVLNAIDGALKVGLIFLQLPLLFAVITSRKSDGRRR